MDPTVDPCTDFYQFTCGNWAKNNMYGYYNPQYSNFDILKYKLYSKIINYYSSSLPLTTDEPEAVTKSRHLYNGCRNSRVLDEIGYDPIIETLHNLSLPIVPSFFTNGSSSLTDFDWVTFDVRSRKTLGLNVFMSVSIEPNVFNISENRLYLEPPSRQSLIPSILKTLKQYVLEASNDIDPDFFQSYKTFLKEAMRVVFREKLHEVPKHVEVRLSRAIQAILKAENHFDMLYDEDDIVIESSDDVVALTLNDLDNVTNQLLLSINSAKTNIWTKYLSQLFDNIIEIDGDEVIFTTNETLSYYVSAIEHIERTKVEMELYSWWLVIESMLMSTTTDIRFYLRKLMLPFQPDIYIPSRDQECASILVDFMEMAASYAIFNASFETEIKPKVQEIQSNIQAVFAQTISENGWLDELTKKHILQKSSHTSTLIGYPTWLFQDSQLDSLYSDVFADEKTHIMNMLSIIQTSISVDLAQLREQSGFISLRPLKYINALNIPLLNTIMIPRAIVSFPFYHRGLEYLNYGAIGSILGHEFTHSFDPVGIKFDQFGTIRDTWTEKSRDIYSKLTQCFVDQYSAFYVEQIQKYANGSISLDENIADNGGVHLAYKALQKFLNENSQTENRYLPGFEDFTVDQMFFIAFGSIWCDKVNDKYLNQQIKELHGPSRVRVRGVVANSDEFKTAFNCPIHRNLTKCQLW